jgi:hypothetical protein
MNCEFSIANYCCAENGKHLQKTVNYHTKCDGAVARARVSFFICLLGILWLLLWIADAINSVQFEVLNSSQMHPQVTRCHRLSWMQFIQWFVANEKWYSWWLLGFYGCPVSVEVEELPKLKVAVLKKGRHL